MYRSIFYLVAFAALVTTARGDDARTFERDIRPIFKAHCLDCHGATAELEGGLDLRLRRFLVRGGDSGPAIEPGAPEASYLLERIRSQEMPPGEKKMPAAEVAVIERWIAAGAATARDEPEQLDEGMSITPEEREFWSFQPLQRPEVPTSHGSAGARTAIDHFIRAKLLQAGLDFSPDADDLTLLMRASFDLTGLPPTPEEVEAYRGDESADKYDALIERLLASPRYGERWARHWLDIAGYADTEGYTPADADRPWAYRYRDYVIKSLNTDKPFNEFVLEQLAGDELVAPPHANLTEEQIDQLAATGFLRMAGDGTGSGANNDDARNQTIADTIKIVSTSLLGLSVGCAQCHDHRYDPISHTDYYRLRAIIEPALNWKRWRTPQQRLISLYTDEDRAKAAEIEAEAQVIATEKNELQTKYIKEELEKELTKFPADLRDPLRAAYDTAGDQRTVEQKRLLDQHPSVNISGGTLYQYNQKKADEVKAFDTRIAEVRGKKPVEQFVRALTETADEIPPTHLFYRGEYKQPKQEVSPAGMTISSLPGERFEIPDNDENLPTSGRRLAYARWLFSGKHPLVGRVLVNRVWMHHLGRGIVGTPSDFGVLGQRPTHPRLLDWLAVEFAESGWSLKQLHKKIMLSTVYRQSSRSDSRKMAVDGPNRWYWRKPVVRLDAEALYDRILATCGTLKHQLYGPPAAIEADDTGQTIVAGDANRRGIYVKVKRTQPVALLKSFDAPVMQVNCESRPTSTAATQALMLMNSQFILKHAGQLAQRIRQEAAEVTPPEVEFDATQVRDPIDDWQYGHGHLDPELKKIDRFMPLPHWTGHAWQGGAKLPDPTLGWALLNASGGHPNGDPQGAVIRRWTSPVGGVVKITGKLSHGSDHGDGVEATLVSSRAGVVGHWIGQNGSAETNTEELQVQAGDVLDFHTGGRGSVTSDSFTWTVAVNLLATSGQELAWDSVSDFDGPRAERPALPQQAVRAWQLTYGRLPTDDELNSALDFLVEQTRYLRAHRKATQDPSATTQAITNLCQVLLSSNEFLYLD